MATSAVEVGCGACFVNLKPGVRCNMLSLVPRRQQAGLGSMEVFKVFWGVIGVNQAIHR